MEIKGNSQTFLKGHWLLHKTTSHIASIELDNCIAKSVSYTAGCHLCKLKFSHGFAIKP